MTFSTFTGSGKLYLMDDYGNYRELGDCFGLSAGSAEVECDHCRGLGTDPMADHMLPCPVCDGEGRTTGGE